MKIKFEVLGTPRSKQRPRICNFQGRKFSYTTKKTKEYENLIKELFSSFTKILEQGFTSKNGHNCLLPYSKTTEKTTINEFA